MNLKDLRPAAEFAVQYGFKSVVFGPPGSAKTPLINTAPNPVMLACEPGLLSMRGSKVPTWGGFTITAIEDFFKWLFHSNETKSFDTVAVDSVSQLADIYLQDALKKNKHGMAAYGEMADNVMKHLRPLYYLQNKHTYLICKQHDDNEGGMIVSKPYFPGKILNVDVPHLFDAILHLGTHNVPQMGQVRSFQCAQTMDVRARDRSGKLGMFEAPDFGALVQKAMA